MTIPRRTFLRRAAAAGVAAGAAACTASAPDAQGGTDRPGGQGLQGGEASTVRGNKAPLQPGMCFSDEPMLAIYGEFGIRLEDCLDITESGATFFMQPSPAIDRPFA